MNCSACKDRPVVLRGVCADCFLKAYAYGVLRAEEDELKVARQASLDELAKSDWWSR